MFRSHPKNIDELLGNFLRESGLETPLQIRRAIDAWDEVAGNMASNYINEKYIRNQILYIKVTRPALRNDLIMMRTELVNKINQKVGSRIISDIRFY